MRNKRRGVLLDPLSLLTIHPNNDALLPQCYFPALRPCPEIHLPSKNMTVSVGNKQNN